VARLGILGGTFNPIHLGHLAAAEEVCDRLRLDSVLFIPAFHSPHKQEGDMPPPAERLELVRLAVAGNPRFAVSTIEMERGGRSYTIDTIDALRARHPGADLYFITGLDSFLDISTWKDWQRLLASCSFVVLSREGYRFSDLAKLPFLSGAEREFQELDGRIRTQQVVRSGAISLYLENIPFYEISSTDIRRRIRQGRSIKYHLPEAVERYIIEKKLYG
jgi:nicotinate-nucleotide adenylyltransferase